jgi:hypothetical protein
VSRAIKETVDLQIFKNSRLKSITSDINDAIRQSARYPLAEIERKKARIDELNTFILGALGEQKVVKVLESLSDDFHLINDFTVSLSPALYGRRKNEYIKSVQIDHVLVAPSGVFLIETKNWSDESLKNVDLRSPVEQIKRSGFVIFKLVNNELSNKRLRLDTHHWGDKKISIRNIIVFTNSKPKEDFQYVKVLTIKEIIGYINHFKPVFTSDEVQRISDFIVQINKTTWQQFN